jgi:cytochrome c-type biogenesis protein CcmI
MLLAITVFVLTVGVGVYILYPLIDRRTAQTNTESEIEELILRRDQLFNDIRELEFDYRTGKLNDADYQQLLGELKSNAATVIEALESEQPGHRPADHKPRRTVSDADIEARISQARKIVEDSNVPCPSCGHRNGARAKFCSECGASMVSESKERSS